MTLPRFGPFCWFLSISLMSACLAAPAASRAFGEALEAGNLSASADASGRVTFNKHIAPLIFSRCAACHRPGEVAPFSLLTYHDVSKRSEQVAAVIERRTMPPWKPLTGHGEFSNGRRLTDEEIETVRRWVTQGLPEGQAADLPAAPVFSVGWQLGVPDLIVAMPAAFEVPSDGPDQYRNVVLPFHVPAGKFLKAAEYRPSNRRVVHHAVLCYDTSGRSRQRDAADPALGFTAVIPPGWNLPGTLAIWSPGRVPMPLAAGISMPWPHNADLVLNVHLHPSGKPELEQSSVGFYFTNEAPRQSLVEIALSDTKIDISPDDNDYRTHDSQVLPIDMDLLQIFPHMHLLGKEMRVTATLPDGAVKDLLWIDDWDADWQGVYQYAQPIRLPKGTSLLMQAVHDNSTDNPRNPNSPPVRVRYGQQTFNEMAVAFLNLVPVQESDMRTLRAHPAPRMHMTIFTESAFAAFTSAASKPKLSSSRATSLPGVTHTALKPAIAVAGRLGPVKLEAGKLITPAAELGHVDEVLYSDVSGKVHSPGEWGQSKAVVLLFLGTECPVSNGYAPEMSRLAKKYGDAGVQFYGVHCDRDVTAEIAQRHAVAHSITFTLRLDHDQRLAHQAGAATTPQAVVLSPGGEVVYRGRIDNRYTPEGKRRPEATIPELAAAIDDVLAGKSPVEPETKAYGCPLPRLAVLNSTP